MVPTAPRLAKRETLAGETKNNKILRKYSASSSKSISTLICFPIATMLDSDSWDLLQPIFAINNNYIITIRLPLIFHQQINHELHIQFNQHICQIQRNAQVDPIPQCLQFCHHIGGVSNCPSIATHPIPTRISNDSTSTSST